MKIYAIRDRLLDYYQQPFIAQGDKHVLAAVSNQLHNGENIDWQNAPHHFEIWRLGQVTEEGHVEQGRELLATLDSLIRKDLRHPHRTPARTEEDDPTAEIGRGKTPSTYHDTKTVERAPAGPLDAKNSQAPPTQGSTRPTDG